MNVTEEIIGRGLGSLQIYATDQSKMSEMDYQFVHDVLLFTNKILAKINRSLDYSSDDMSMVVEIDREKVKLAIMLLQHVVSTRTLRPLFDRDVNIKYWTRFEAFGYLLYSIFMNPLILR